MHRADGTPIQVLVVDDEAVLAEMVSMALRYEGLVGHHRRRRRVGDRGRPHYTPGRGGSRHHASRHGGLEVLRALRELIPTLPVLLLTAKDGVEDRIAGLTAGGMTM